MIGEASHLQNDQIIDKYRVVRRLGAGGMGAIYVVEHQELKEVYRALKVLIPSGNEAGATDARFEREAKIAMHITSKHAVKVVDYGHLPFGPPHWGAPYLVMELLEGDDLAKVLTQRGRLPIEEAARYIHEACDALAELHDENVVHRDIKPGNLFLVRGPRGRRYLKVLDFGIAKVMPNAEKLTFKHMTGEYSIGTLAYMSPEQILRPREVDQRTDIWALGVVLFELVTGELPFQAATPQALPLEITGTPAPALSSIISTVPPAFEAVILKCLQKDPRARYETAHDLMVALQPIVAPLPRDSRPQEEVDHEAVTRPFQPRDVLSNQRQPSQTRPAPHPPGPIVPIPPSPDSQIGLVATTPMDRSSKISDPGVAMPAAPRTSPILWGVLGALAAAVIILLVLRTSGGSGQAAPLLEQTAQTPTVALSSTAAPTASSESTAHSTAEPSSQPIPAKTGASTGTSTSTQVHTSSTSPKGNSTATTTQPPVTPWNPTGHKRTNNNP